MREIIYFSGTGNTHYIAEMIQKWHEEKGETVVMTPIEVTKPTAKAWDQLYVGFPIYACDMPDYMRDYLHMLPPGNGMPVKLFATYGMFVGDGMVHAIKGFESMGYRVNGILTMKMPGSDGLAFLKKDGKAAAKLMSNEMVDIEAVGKWLASDENITWEKASPIRSRLMIGAMHLSEKWMKNKYYADERCIKCEKCVSLCPTANISMISGQIEFANRCMLCMRCVHQCPAEAIQIGKGTVDKYRYKGPNGQFKPPVLR